MAFTLVQTMTDKQSDTDSVSSMTDKTASTASITSVTDKTSRTVNVTDKGVSSLQSGMPIGLLLSLTYTV